MFANCAISLSKKFFYLCLSFTIGILLTSFWQQSWIIIPAFLILVIVTTLLFEKRDLFFLFLISFFLLGIIRTYSVLNYQPSPQEKEVMGTVLRVGSGTSFVLDSGKDRILVFSRFEDYLNQSDKVIIRGDIRQSSEASLMKDRIYLISFYPEIEIIEEKGASLVKERISFHLRNREGAILQAMILGDRDKISTSWRKKLSSAGVSHIVAVSGMHVAVVGMVFCSIALSLGLGKKISLLFSIAGIIFFVLLTGGQASAIRAGIMGSTVIVSKILGRQSHSFRILVLTGATMLFFNPLLLRYDISFQLSFAAVSGIILFAGSFKERLAFLPETAQEVTATSFSAYMFALPLLGYYFNEVSLLFPLSNLLIIPTLYWVIFLGIFFALFSLFSNLLASIVALPLFLVLNYITNVVDLISSIPWATIKITNSFIFLYIIFLCLVCAGKET